MYAADEVLAGARQVTGVRVFRAVLMQLVNLSCH